METISFSLLDRHFADFIVRIDRRASTGLWWAAALASSVSDSGHTCFNLADVPGCAVRQSEYAPPEPMPTDAGIWRDSLERCESVGSPGEYTPLVLDSAGRLYLHRCWNYERQVADGILLRSGTIASDENVVQETLGRYFPMVDDTIDLQRLAAELALGRRFSVISGGPGTGKTATVARILALLLETARGDGKEIALAAPTGKAAMRLQQSILHAVERLDLPEQIKKSFPVNVSTIHRLLGVHARKGGFRHNRDHRLACDILVVDEASMVDLRLMAALFEALRDEAAVILLGDRNQLASVEAGSVLADICESADEATVPVTQLTKSYRFSDDSGIAALSQLIKNGESAAAVDLLLSGCCSDISWRPLPAGRIFEDYFKEAARVGYAGYGVAASPAEALGVLNLFRVLSPLRSGPYGVENLNRLCRAALGPGQGDEAGNLNRLPVMITGNNYELGLFNGDIGVIMDSSDGQYGWFENSDGGLRHISALRLPHYEPAFCTTVHKSQGSEFDRVLLLLPEQMPESMSRELLYTAVTRARCHIEIWGTTDGLCQAIEKTTMRMSGLKDRLKAGVP